LATKVLHPPNENEIGRCEPVICPPPDKFEGKKGCGFTTEIQISKEISAWGLDLAVCPHCGEGMIANLSGYSTGISARGPGFHSTKFGMRRKRDMIRRNEKLRTSQWENHEPPPLLEGKKITNPTKDGPYDPNGRMHK